MDRAVARGNSKGDTPRSHKSRFIAVAKDVISIVSAGKFLIAYRKCE